MDIINLEIDGNSTYLMTYLGDLYLPHRTLILLVVIGITLRCVKLFRERKQMDNLGFDKVVSIDHLTDDELDIVADILKDFKQWLDYPLRVWYPQRVA